MDIFLAKLSTFGNALPGDITQGLIWGIMAIGVFSPTKYSTSADLTVDGTLGLGGVVAVVHSFQTACLFPWLCLLHS